MPESESASRMRRMRGHRNNEHSDCQYRTCEVRQQLEMQNEERLDAIALFGELARHDIDPLTFLGDDFDVYRERAGRELPDYDYLPTSPDIVNRLRARGAVREYLAGIPRQPELIPVHDEEGFVIAPRRVKPTREPDSSPDW